MKCYLRTYGATLMALVSCSHALANGVEALRTFVQDLKTLQGEFSQQTTDAQGKPSKTLSGTFVLAQGGKFRFDYVKPYTQVLVSDGKVFSTYDADLAQMTNRKLDQALAATPLAVLSGQAALDSVFTLKPLPAADGLTWVSATAKQPDAAVSDLRFGFKGNELRALSWVDHFNKRTLMRFENLKRNVKLEPGVFSFQPPAGTEIVGP